MTFLNLPIEIIEQILKFLSCEDLAKCKKVHHSLEDPCCHLLHKKYISVSKKCDVVFESINPQINEEIKQNITNGERLHVLVYRLLSLWSLKRYLSRFDESQNTDDESKKDGWKVLDDAWEQLNIIDNWQSYSKPRQVEKFFFIADNQFFKCFELYQKKINDTTWKPCSLLMQYELVHHDVNVKTWPVHYSPHYKESINQLQKTWKYAKLLHTLKSEIAENEITVNIVKRKICHCVDFVQNFINVVSNNDDYKQFHFVSSNQYAYLSYFYSSSMNTIVKSQFFSHLWTTHNNEAKASNEQNTIASTNEVIVPYSRISLPSQLNIEDKVELRFCLFSSSI